MQPGYRLVTASTADKSAGAPIAPHAASVASCMRSPRAAEDAGTGRSAPGHSHGWQGISRAESAIRSVFEIAETRAGCRRGVIRPVQRAPAANRFSKAGARRARRPGCGPGGGAGGWREDQRQRQAGRKEPLSSITARRVSGWPRSFSVRCLPPDEAAAPALAAVRAPSHEPHDDEDGHSDQPDDKEHLERGEDPAGGRDSKPDGEDRAEDCPDDPAHVASMRLQTGVVSARRPGLAGRLAYPTGTSPGRGWSQPGRCQARDERRRQPVAPTTKASGITDRNRNVRPNRRYDRQPGRQGGRLVSRRTG